MQLLFRVDFTMSVVVLILAMLFETVQIHLRNKLTEMCAYSSSAAIKLHMLMFDCHFNCTTILSRGD